MKPLQITARLSNGFAVSDNFSPAIEGLIEYKLREKLGLLHPNPIKLSDIVPIELPLQKHFDGYYHASSPHYIYNCESQVNFRKRWDQQDKHLNWGKKKAKFDSAAGQFKSYDLPIFLRNTNQIDWFVVGKQTDIADLLTSVTHIGKKRSQGYGLILGWTVQEIAHDWSIYGAKGQLTRPIPCLEKKQLPENTSLAAWKLPSWHHESISLCWVPSHNTKLETSFAS
jgi:hypothetical protein